MLLILSMILSQRRQYISSCYSCTLSVASASQFTEPAIHKMSVWHCTPRQQHSWFPSHSSLPPWLVALGVQWKGSWLAGFLLKVDVRPPRECAIPGRQGWRSEELNSGAIVCLLPPSAPCLTSRPFMRRLPLGLGAGVHSLVLESSGR